MQQNPYQAKNMPYYETWPKMCCLALLRVGKVYNIDWILGLEIKEFFRVDN